MYSLLIKRALVMRRPIILKSLKTLNVFSFRQFQTSSFVSAKGKKQKVQIKKGKKGMKEEEIEEDQDAVSNEPLIDFEDATSKFKGVIERFSKQANEAKLGKTNPNIFNKLVIETADGELPFTSVAQTTVKGRNFIITVFDPSHIQEIINCVLSSNLNMNPQVDPTNKSTLKVPLPPLTSESKRESAKDLKGVFERFKNGTGRPNSSLGAVRADIKSKIQKKTKKHKLNDVDTKLMNDFEKLHKEYVDKLSEIFKSAEKSILK